MNILKEIHDRTKETKILESIGVQYELRKTARGIIFNEVGNIAIQHLQKRNYHKLPGGGIELGETTEQALKREVIEEVGCKINTPTPIGTVIEYRNYEQILQISYCYYANTIGVSSEPNLEPGEIEEGQVTIWATPEEALVLMRNDTPNEHQGYFILEREISFIEEYLKNK